MSVLMSTYPDRIIVIGKVTGKRYEFPHGGSTTEVDDADVPDMLSRMFGGKSCCGSGVVPRPEFIIVT
jgi:hypothetical protein